MTISLPNWSPYVKRSMARCQINVWSSLSWASMALHSSWPKVEVMGSTSRMTSGLEWQRVRPLQSSQDTLSGVVEWESHPGVSTTVTWVVKDRIKTRVKRRFRLKWENTKCTPEYSPVFQRRCHSSWGCELFFCETLVFPGWCFLLSSSHFVSLPATAQPHGRGLDLDLRSIIDLLFTHTQTYFFKVFLKLLKSNSPYEASM